MTKNTHAVRLAALAALTVLHVPSSSHAQAPLEVQLQRAKDNLTRTGELLANGARRLKDDPENWSCSQTGTVLFTLVKTVQQLERLSKEARGPAIADVPELLGRARELRKVAGVELLACAEARAPEFTEQGKLGNLEDALRELDAFPGRTHPRVSALAKKYACTYGGGARPFVACRP